MQRIPAVKSVPPAPSSRPTDAALPSAPVPDSDTRLAQRQRLETLGVLASGVAHDFNNLLTGIVGHTDVAEALLPADHPARIELKRVQAGATRAAALARRMLNFGRPGPSRRAPVDLVTAIEDALPLLRSSLPRRIELRHRFSISGPALVLADSNQLQQVFLNLGLSAGQAMSGHDGTIEVTVERAAGGPPPPVHLGHLERGPHLCISVLDTGRRLDEAARRRMFEPDFVGTPGECDAASGLSIVRDLVLQMHGGLAVHSSVGEGTTVRACFPEVAPPPAGQPVVFEPARSQGAPAHVAIVDDEETVVRLSRQALEFSGYRTSALASPQECLEHAARQPAGFDLIITDQRMPTMTGIEMVQALRAMGNRTPVLITSGSIDAVTFGQLQAVAPARFIPKPFTLVDLLGAVYDLIDAGARAAPK